MSLHDIFDREGDLGEDTCRRLEISTVLLICQLLHVLGIVLNLVELQYLFCSIETVVEAIYYDTICNAIFCLGRILASVLEDELCIPDLSHVTCTTYILDIEARTNIVQELVVGLEVLWMLCVCLQNI